MTEHMVSVVIATWNSAKYLAETIESALAQTYAPIEIIVVDDGSTDDTSDVVEPYLHRIRYMSREHEGLAAARNAGIAAAEGSFIALLDADDLWMPDKLTVQMQVAACHPGSGLIVCDGVEFDGDAVLSRRLLGPALAQVVDGAKAAVTGQFHRELLASSAIYCPAQTLIPTATISSVGPFTDSSAQDYDYWLRITQRFPITLHPDSLVRWRYRADSMSGPREHRAEVWGRRLLPVLDAHARRCNRAERQIIEDHRRRVIRTLVRAAYGSGLEANRAAAAGKLVRLLRAQPFPPIAAPYMLGLAMPAPLRTLVRTTRAAARRRRTWGSVHGYGRVEPMAPGLAHIVPAGARVERVAHGFGFTEGPVWMPEGHLLFGDLPNNVIRRWHPNEGTSVVRSRTGYDQADQPPGFSMGSNGMTLDHSGRLLICEPGNRRVTRVEPDGELTVIADAYEGKRLNSPNDIVCRSDGTIYFTDPPHGLIGEDNSPHKELDFNGVYRVSDGEIHLVGDEMTRPNGIAFSPDERYLYVSNSDPRRKIWMRFEVLADGGVHNGIVFLDLTDHPGQPPDGLKVDVEGNFYLTGPEGLWIVDAAGKVLGLIRTEMEPANCAWGDADSKTLYLTARGDVYRIRLSIPGVALASDRST